MILETNLLKADSCVLYNNDDVAHHADEVDGYQDDKPVTNHVGSNAVHSEIPPYYPSGKVLLNMQKKSDTLAKCSAAVFMIDDIGILKELDNKVSCIHSELLLTASTNLSSEQIPVMKCLMKDEISKYKRKICLITRANQLTKKYRTMRETKKRKANIPQCPLPVKKLKLKDDPLNMTSRRSVGRPKGKK